MKVILSRKGFDSSSGGHPSPVFPDGTMLSMPIPVHPRESFETKYSNLYIPECIKLPCDFIACENYSDIIKSLYGCNVSYNYKEKENGKKVARTIETEYCHADPDILNYKGCTKGGTWKGLFGQAGSAESHLRNTEVDKGDLFLFFGKFRKVDESGKFKSDEKEFHAIWGYLQVGEAHRDRDMITRLKCVHSHKDEAYLKGSFNTIYEASEKLTILRSLNLPGAGVFNLSDNRILTNRELNKEEQRLTKWKLPEFFKELEISHHRKENTKVGFQPDSNGGYFQSVRRGQEFVIQKHKDDKDTKNEKLLYKWLEEDVFSKSTLNHC